jgi:hypothetical protein
MKHPKTQRIAPDGTRDGQAHRRKHVLTAKRPKRRTERDVNGMTRTVLRPRAMRNGFSPGRRPAASPRARPAPSIGESELLLDEGFPPQRHPTPPDSTRGIRVQLLRSARHLKRL